MVVIIAAFFIIGIGYVIYGLTKIFIQKRKEFLSSGGVKYIRENGGFIFFCKLIIKKYKDFIKKYGTNYTNQT